MKRLPRINEAEVVIHGVLKIVWTDGYEGVVDLRPVMERGKIFTYLQNPANSSPGTPLPPPRWSATVGDRGHREGAAQRR